MHTLNKKKHLYENKQQQPKSVQQTLYIHVYGDKSEFYVN